MNIRASTRQSGTSLIEALLALVLIGIGMLGYALAILNSAAVNRDALYRSQAVMQVQGMAERIQTNRSGIDTYDGLNTLSIEALEGCDSDCTPQRLAEQHVLDWADELTNLLRLPRPLGQVSVADVGNIVRVDIELLWQAAHDEEPQSVSLTLDVPEK